MANEDINTQKNIEGIASQDTIRFLNSLYAEPTIRDCLIDELYGTDFTLLEKQGDEAFSVGFYDIALNYYIRAYNLGEQLIASSKGDFAFIAGSFMSAKIGNVYIQLSDYDRAFYWYDKAQNLIKDGKNFKEQNNLTINHWAKMDKTAVVIFIILGIICLFLVYGIVFFDLSHSYSPLIIVTVAEAIILVVWSSLYRVATDQYPHKRKH